MWYTLSTKQVEQQMKTNINIGLNEKQVQERQVKFRTEQTRRKKE